MKSFTFFIIISALIFGLSFTGDPRNSSQNGKNVKFEWDFSQEKKFIYSYNQIIHDETIISKGDLPELMNMTGDGIVTVKVKPNEMADVIMSDLIIESVYDDQNGNVRKPEKMAMQTTVAQDMAANGSFGDDNVDLLFGLLLPLPKIKLSKGESDKIPMKYPFRANGSVLFSKGFNTLTFTGYESLLGRNCAVLEGVIDISDFEVPEELKGEYECYSTGYATYYFDTDARCYIGADIYWKMNALMDTELVDGNNTSMYMKMMSENTFKIRLDRIE